jgi:hypothetical protein
MKRFAPGPFLQLLDNMPATTVPRNVDQILELIDSIGMYQVPGMVSCDALPVRTTFLHMFYPTVIPIFDKMVLKAVGAWKPPRTNRGLFYVDTCPTPGPLPRDTPSNCAALKSHRFALWTWPYG